MAFATLRVVEEKTPLGFTFYYLEDRHWWMPIWDRVSDSMTSSKKDITTAFNERIQGHKKVILEG